jgi:hypothetical protein
MVKKNSEHSKQLIHALIMMFLPFKHYRIKHTTYKILKSRQKVFLLH